MNSQDYLDADIEMRGLSGHKVGSLLLHALVSLKNAAGYSNTFEWGSPRADRGTSPKWHLEPYEQTRRKIASHLLGV